MAKTRSDHFLFGSICIKKSNQTGFFLKNRNRTGTGSNRPGLVWLGYFRKKPVQPGLAQFFSGSVRFFQFQAYKTETEPVGFFKILIGFFSQFGFFYFLGLISFSIFLLISS
jgi:hypothetical protein